ncbi:MAG: transcription termination factor Rho [Luteolibacter sp.]|jgi:transcription termination factor Rho
MHILGLTGGMACGKSTVSRAIRSMWPGTVVFDADACVRDLLDTDPEVAAEIRATFGNEIVGPSGTLDRDALRARVFADAAERAKLEAILHPRVREECLASRDRARKNSAGLFVADIPLLFEKGFDFGQSAAMLVAASHETQVRRIRARNRFDDPTIEAILAAQLPLEAKLLHADVVFWNEGPQAALLAQVRRFLNQLKMTPTEEIQNPENDDAVDSSPAATAVAEHPSVVSLPASIDINAFRKKPLAELQDISAAVPVRIQPGIPKSQLIYELLCFYAAEGVGLVCEGVVEPAKDTFAILRDPEKSFRPGPDDIHINANMLRDHGIRPGQGIKIRVRSPREKGKFLSTAEILEVEGIPVAEFTAGKEFDKLTAMFPDQRLHLDGTGPEFLSVRVLDIIAPLGKGQRGLIVAPPRGGKTILLKQIAKAIRANHPEAELIVLLLDERPEEVTDFEETVGCRVFSSTFDEAPKRHAQVADMVIERAKRLVECGKDVVLLLDSLTRLARGHNSAMQGGPIGSGGVSPAALAKSRKFFGTARNCEEGGSLTILATALVETESRMDDVVFEEFKGTGNMEVKLDRELAERRVYPAIHIPQSGTRNDDRLYHPDEFRKIVEIRKHLAALPIGDALETILRNLRETSSNAELLLRGMR